VDVSAGWVLVAGRARSGGGGEGSDAGERLDELGLPGPAGRQAQREAPGVADQAAGKLKQSSANGARGADRAVGEAE